VTAIRLPPALAARLLAGARIGPDVSADAPARVVDTLRARYCPHGVTVYYGCPTCLDVLRCGECHAAHRCAAGATSEVPTC